MSEHQPNTTKRLSGGGDEDDRRALARCWECFDDGQDTDIGAPLLNRLTALGWLERTKRNQWTVTDEGDRILCEMGVLT